MDSTEVDADDESSASSQELKNVVLDNLRRREKSWKQYGNYHAFCGDYILIGPVRSWWWILELFIIVVTITFITEYKKYNWIVFTIGLVLFLIVFLSSCKTLLTDPGIIKRPSFPEAIKNATHASQLMSPTYRGVYMDRFNERGEKVRHSYCFRCHVWKPPSAGHCTVCGCCQLDWDHHCPIFGGCVAKKNLVAFHFMAASIPIFIIYLITASVISVVFYYQKDDVDNVMMKSIVLDEIIIGIVAGFVLTPILTLLPCENKTSYDPPDNRIRFGMTMGFRSLKRDPAEGVTRKLFQLYFCKQILLRNGQTNSGEFRQQVFMYV